MNGARHQKIELHRCEQREIRRHERRMEKIQKERLSLQKDCVHPHECRALRFGAFSEDGWTECLDCGASVGGNENAN